jgi:tripartite-type tricarboxylate transporter receptor subunit TctC
LVRTIGGAIDQTRACTLFAAVQHPGQDYPSRPIRMLIPSPPGEPSDFAGRLIAPKLADLLG